MTSSTIPNMITTFSGIVQHGHKHWRAIWFPTINIPIERGVVPEGTYYVHVIISTQISQPYLWAWVSLPHKWVFETHIIDFEGDLYDQDVTIIVQKKIRENQSFNSLQDLKTQIAKDITTVRQLSQT